MTAHTTPVNVAAPADMRDIRVLREEMQTLKERIRYLEEIIEVLLKRRNSDELG